MSKYIQINNNDGRLLIDDTITAYGLKDKVSLASTYSGTANNTCQYELGSRYGDGSATYYKPHAIYQLGAVGSLWAVTAKGSVLLHPATTFAIFSGYVYLAILSGYSLDLSNMYVYHFVQEKFNDKGNVGIKCYNANGEIVFNSNTHSCRRGNWKGNATGERTDLAVMIPTVPTRKDTNNVKYFCSYLKYNMAAAYYAAEDTMIMEYDKFWGNNMVLIFDVSNY